MVSREYKEQADQMDVPQQAALANRWKQEAPVLGPFQSLTVAQAQGPNINATLGDYASMMAGKAPWGCLDFKTYADYMKCPVTIHRRDHSAWIYEPPNAKRPACHLWKVNEHIVSLEGKPDNDEWRKGADTMPDRGGRVAMAISNVTPLASQ